MKPGAGHGGGCVASPWALCPGDAVWGAVAAAIAAACAATAACAHGSAPAVDQGSEGEGVPAYGSALTVGQRPEGAGVPAGIVSDAVGIPGI